MERFEYVILLYVIIVEAWGEICEKSLKWGDFEASIGGSGKRYLATLCANRRQHYQSAMDRYRYVLFRGPKRLNLKEEDMTTDKISRIFQVCNLFSRD